MIHLLKLRFRLYNFVIEKLECYSYDTIDTIIFIENFDFDLLVFRQNINNLVKNKVFMVFLA